MRNEINVYTDQRCVFVKGQDLWIAGIRVEGDYLAGRVKLSRMNCAGVKIHKKQQSKAEEINT